MDFYEKIKDKSSEEVKTITRERITELENEKKDEEHNIIGYKVEYEPTLKEMEIVNGERTFGVDLRCFYNGYIRKDTKIVYGLKYTYDGVVSNDGDYYYIDDDSYIYEFTEYLRNQEVTDEYDILFFILEFLKKYFGVIKKTEREDMHKPIYKDETSYYPPTRKNELTDFKGLGNALCSEYATMAQNLMSVFGINSSIVIGSERTSDDAGNDNEEYHAYNIVELHDEETKELRAFVCDFINYVITYDINYEIIEIMPFLGEIDLSDELIEDIIYKGRELTFNDYSLMYLGNSVSKLGYERTRTYFIDGYINPQKVLKKEKK